MRINEITVAAEYCFGSTPLVLENLAKVNFVHAPNGSGKTTISNALSNQPLEPHPRSTWEVAATDTSIAVFNEAYRSKVLKEHVAGIFTIGSDSSHVNEQIELLEQERATRRAQRESWTKEIGSNDAKVGMSGLLGRLETERLEATHAIFESHKVVSAAVRETVFKGFRTNRAQFFTEANSRHRTQATVPEHVTWETLEARNASLTGAIGKRPALSPISTISLLSEEQIDQLQADDLTVGTGEFAALIQHLANGDWVSQGRQHLPDAGGKCPFCQQGLPEGFGPKLTAYFAAGYDEALAVVDKITAVVSSRSQTLETELGKLEASIEADSAIDAGLLAESIESIRTTTALVLSQLRDKRRHPTSGITIEDVAPLARHLNDLIGKINADITQHNALVDDAKAELQKLVDDGWTRFLTDGATPTLLKKYQGIEASTEANIKKIRTQISESHQADTEGMEEITKLRDSISNTAAVAARINRLLTALGFHRFHLATAKSVAGGYRIERKDGSLAFDSLSEGEKSFVCFIYFMESLTGSVVSGGPIEPVIAVIDDPISSLDSDTLFIVAAYIRKIAKEVIEGKTNIDQLIVLTHNTQFHHEAAYTPSEPKAADRRHYRLRKGLDQLTKVENDGARTKIRGSYELLWQSVVDIARGDEDTPIAQVGVFNIVRRIIEGYFKTVGSTEPDEVKQPLSVPDQLLMSTFETWANAGSHTIIDDFAQSQYIGGAKQFLQLLQLFFTQQGHDAHFNMMIRACGGDSLLQAGSVFSQQAA